ncbi:hypothetical protein LPB140_04260 [Sphingorhabdus lutea]|uniref:Uncharacterized protein n=1 Tax=Sphingorhabdus lutea TaxID=1913578 RepID=A0A1L3JAK5_9SPHN|nr:hypothetical protein [Sphingorhabdus lutea]APG62149.1 hypothetical protein LPB140_04260 [Sphingorhabdus lutea]
MEMLREVEKFLRENDMPPTKFGRLVAHDPRLVLDMRMGREVRSAMQRKIRQFIDENCLKKAA